jgi:maltose-binding protein MalE
LAHNNIPIEVRIKAVSGIGGLLDALSAANTAAPLALPDLVALSRSDLEVAALKGLLAPFDGSSSTFDDADWFAYARQMALLQGSSFGLPFAGDALVLLYRPTQVMSIPANWDTLLSQGGILAFPAGDPQALFTLSLYLSAGGEVEDSQHRPVLNSEALVKVLKLFEKGTTNKNIPAWLTQYQTDGQAWQAFKEQRSAWVVTWVSNYLAELPADTTLLPLLPVGNQPLTIATGWVWALGKPQALANSLSVELAESLVKGDFLAKWTAAAGYLPPRPTALAGWTNQSLQSLLSQVVLSAQLRPANDLMVSLGPALRDATLQVLKGQNDAVQAAQAASEHLKGP